MQGDLVALGPLSRDLLPVYQRWMNNLRTLRTLGVIPHPMTMEQEEAWYERAARSDETVSFTIYELGSWRPIGNASWMSIDHYHRTATYGILIGEQDARGKGYGTETTRLMLDYAFTALGLHNVLLHVFAYNLAGIRAYEKAGYREIGRRHACHFMGGRFWDEVLMECLATEFRSSVLAPVFAPDEPRTPA